MERNLEVLVASPDEGLRAQVALELGGERYTVPQVETTDPFTSLALLRRLERVPGA